MTEPLFFDCLTDAQFWSLFDSGVLHAYMLPGEVYERLKRIAPAHGCYLFTWPADVALPLLQDIVPSRALPGQELAHQAHSDGLQTPMIAEQMRSEIEAFCARVHAEMSAEGGRIHVIAMTPDIELRAGPYLEPQARDLTAMSMPELEAYLDAMLRLDDRTDIGSAASCPDGPLANHRNHAPPSIFGADMTRPL
jgi:hypothetical protein